jgi:hypothetical protein
MDTFEKNGVSQTLEILNATNSTDKPLSSNHNSSNGEQTHGLHHNVNKLNAHFCEFTDPSRGQVTFLNDLLFK